VGVTPPHIEEGNKNLVCKFFKCEQPCGCCFMIAHVLGQGI